MTVKTNINISAILIFVYLIIGSVVELLIKTSKIIGSFLANKKVYKNFKIKFHFFILIAFIYSKKLQSFHHFFLAQEQEIYLFIYAIQQLHNKK